MILYMIARGTVLVGLKQSSDKCTAPSRPPNPKFGLTRPVRNTIALFSHPVSFMKVAQTYSLDRLGLATAKQVMVMTKSDTIERLTSVVSVYVVAPHQVEQDSTHIQLAEPMARDAEENH